MCTPFYSRNLAFCEEDANGNFNAIYLGERRSESELDRSRQIQRAVLVILSECQDPPQLFMQELPPAS